MNQGESSTKAQDILGQIRDRVFAFQRQANQQQALYGEAVGNVNQLSAARRHRLTSMNDELPEPLWVALIIMQHPFAGQPHIGPEAFTTFLNNVGRH